MSPLDALTSTASQAVTGLSDREFFAKSLTYRLLSVIITILVVYLFTGDILASLNIGLVANVLKTVLYYVFELAWEYVW